MQASAKLAISGPDFNEKLGVLQEDFCNVRRDVASGQRNVFAVKRIMAYRTTAQFGRWLSFTCLHSGKVRRVHAEVFGSAPQGLALGLPGIAKHVGYSSACHASTIQWCCQCWQHYFGLAGSNRCLAPI